LREGSIIESLDAIRQLAAKYALALDMRDSDAWVNLFPETVRAGGGNSGRKSLHDWFDETHSRQFDGTSHPRPVSQLEKFLGTRRRTFRTPCRRSCPPREIHRNHAARPAVAQAPRADLRV
jgi:hypothetical protein